MMAFPCSVEGICVSGGKFLGGTKPIELHKNVFASSRVLLSVQIIGLRDKTGTPSFQFQPIEGIGGNQHWIVE